jgi:hypothetical protein
MFDPAETTRQRHVSISSLKPWSTPLKPIKAAIDVEKTARH